MPRPTHTPFLDAWLEDLRLALDERGARADLARFLATHLQLAPQTASNRVSITLGGHTHPSGETVLAINAWIATRKRGR